MLHGESQSTENSNNTNSKESRRGKWRRRVTSKLQSQPSSPQSRCTSPSIPASKLISPSQKHSKKALKQSVVPPRKKEHVLIRLCECPEGEVSQQHVSQSPGEVRTHGVWILQSNRTKRKRGGLCSWPATRQHRGRWDCRPVSDALL
ncbi:hypothetical protein JZ751_005267 [Albula glossodonta]|uniref:Uncharacterized protein n=1 Tax=Albula glossodonta TaxID=121402 RepID=A0A8T2P2Q4_9TELE|nr:hypothetical protein JZ751_005267 [Albula glossodonta]